jgi:hypothetical protein
VTDQKPVQLRPVGEGYEMSFLGAVPIGTPYIDPQKPVPDHVAALVVTLSERATPEPARTQLVQPLPPKQPATVVAPTPTVPIASPRSVLNAARARVKQIRAELKNKRALERELAELERLIKAAREKPSNVRALKRVG